MLYIPAAPTVAGIVRTGLARVAGFVAAILKTAADEAYLDTLDGDALRDVGVHRIATRDGNIYR